MPRLWLCLVLLAALPALDAREDVKGPTLAGKNTPLAPLVTGLKNPESVCLGPGGKAYVTVIGEFGKDGDGGVVVLDQGKAVPFADGLDDPKGIVWHNGFFYVADNTRVVRIDAKGKAETFVAAKDFPRAPVFLNDVEVTYPSPKGDVLFVSDSGKDGKGGAVFAVPLVPAPKKAPTAGKVKMLVDGEKDAGVKTPNGLFKASQSHVFLLDFGSGKLSRVGLADGKRVEVSEGFGGGDGLARDDFGRLYVSSWQQGKVWVIPRPGERPVLLASGFQSAADCCLAADRKHVLVPDMKAGTVTAIPCTVPGAEVDERDLKVALEPAFAELKWTGFDGVDEKGKRMEHRPMVLTHANDKSGRVFVATQHGVVHAFANDQKAKQTKVFLDIRDRVIYNENENEEGLLGLAFPADYKTNGAFYAYYTPRPSKRLKGENHVNVLSRFRVSKDDPDRADASSEEILLRFPSRPFWNHDGGTIAFGPDGMLYVAVGDGGAANDPFKAGQDLTTLLGKILRIDVSKKGEKLAYAIPTDNPFAARKGARGEVWAYGFRNPWRFSFDKKTGEMWCADVGQDLWEEIDVVTKGGNYGWSAREGLHPFGVEGVEQNEGMIDPVWEYHHDVGKSITGGHVYRGAGVKALEGLYLYADYVSGHVWALGYDAKQKRVTRHHQVRQGGFPIFSFGEDDQGEVYALKGSPDGRGLYRFVQK